MAMTEAACPFTRVCGSRCRAQRTAPRPQPCLVTAGVHISPWSQSDPISLARRDFAVKRRLNGLIARSAPALIDADRHHALHHKSAFLAVVGEECLCCLGLPALVFNVGRVLVLGDSQRRLDSLPHLKRLRIRNTQRPVFSHQQAGTHEFVILDRCAQRRPSLMHKQS
eukprot:6192974-Pleurochrysis_carterae.AAC.3